MTRSEIKDCATAELKKALVNLAGMETHPIYERIVEELKARGE